MSRKSRDVKLLRGTLVSYALVAISFLLMVPYSEKSESRAMNILAGSCFWISLTTGCICQVRLSWRRKEWIRSTGYTGGPKRAGFFNFCISNSGKVADIAMILCIAGLIISVLLTNAAGISCYFFLSATVFTVAAHSIFNGKNYHYLQVRKNTKLGKWLRRRRI